MTTPFCPASSARRLRFAAAATLLLASCAGNEDAAGPASVDERPFFSFFVTSQVGLYGVPAGGAIPAHDPILGFGGNFGGLEGADQICTTLARQSNRSDAKVWRAFLSTSGFNGGERVDAVDRIGPGPWFDFNGRRLATDVAGLFPVLDGGRPRGADPQLAAMFSDENGEPARPNAQVNNHDTLTGSGKDGRLFDDREDGRVATCEDWTSNSVHGEQGKSPEYDGQIPVGHSWPRVNAVGQHWIQEHTLDGCEPGFDSDGGDGFSVGDFRVGAGAGYGGFYCFALGAIPPT